MYVCLRTGSIKGIPWSFRENTTWNKAFCLFCLFYYLLFIVFKFLFEKFQTYRKAARTEQWTLVHPSPVIPLWLTLHHHIPFLSLFRYTDNIFIFFCLFLFAKSLLVNCRYSNTLALWYVSLKKKYSTFSYVTTIKWPYSGILTLTQHYYLTYNPYSKLNNPPNTVICSCFLHPTPLWSRMELRITHCI